MVSGPLRTLQRPRGRQRPTEAEIYFWLKRFFLTSALIPDVPCQSPASSGPSSSLEAIKGRPRPKFFLAQTVPFDLNVNPSWSLPVSAPPRTLLRPQSRLRPTEAEILFGSNGSFRPQCQSLLVPGPPRTLQQP